MPDPMAATAAESTITDLVDRTDINDLQIEVEGCDCGKTKCCVPKPTTVDLADYLDVPVEIGGALSEQLLSLFDATYERVDGKRRLVLVGPWEVDPVAVAEARHAAGVAA